MIPDLKAMTIEEKLLTMRNLWDDIRQNLENTDESEEIIAFLDNRFAGIKSGKAKFLGWDEVKGSIGRR